MPSNLWSDFRFAARSLGRTPGFTAAAILTLAVGVGVNVAIFSLFEQILLRPLPVVAPDRLVNLIDPGPKLPGPAGIRASAAGETNSIFSYPMFRDLERVQESLSGIAAHRVFDASVSTGEQARRETGVFVSGSYFQVLGLQPALGRLLGQQDDRVDGQAESVVLSHAYWQSEFGGDPTVINRALIINGQTLRIVGVAPPGFHGTTVGTRANVFVPITFPGLDTPASLPNHGDRRVYWVHLFARLDQGITAREAAAGFNRSFRSILNEVELPLADGTDEQALEAFRTKSLTLEPGAHGQSSLLVPVRGRLQLLLAVSVAVLFLVCANLAGLVLVRGSARRGEFAVRASLGATRGRLSSLLVAEVLLLAVPAAIACLPIASLTLRGLAIGVPGIPSVAFDVNLSIGVAISGLGIAVLSALAFGFVPLRVLVKDNPGRTLYAYGIRQTSGRVVTRFRSALATTQIALSMALLALTGIFAQSLANIASIDLGLDVDSLVTFSISPEASGYSREASEALFNRLEEQLSAIPGVNSAASAMVPLLSSGSFGFSGFDVQGTRAEEPVSFNAIGADFFRTLGIGILAGREFRDSDAGSASVAIVNRRFAEVFGIDGDVLGSNIRFSPDSDPDSTTEIIGFVANSKNSDVTGEIVPQFFLPRSQSPVPLSSATFYVRGAQPPVTLLNSVRDTVTRVDPIIPVTGLRTMAQQVRENLATEHFMAGVSSVFAVLGTLLAGLGVFGVLAYAVAQRSREIALRVALGATPNRIRATVLLHVMSMVLTGISIGAILSWGLARASSSLLFGVAAIDVISIASAAAVLSIVTLAAALIPARRAATVDPMAALRFD